MGKIRGLQMARPPMAVTSVVRATWQGHGKFFDCGKELVQNVIPLFHTHLLLHWTWNCSARACASEHLQVSFGVFLNTIKPVSWYLYISDKLYSTTKNTSRVSTLWLLHPHILDSYFICRKDFKRIKLVNRR